MDTGHRRRRNRLRAGWSAVQLALCFSSGTLGVGCASGTRPEVDTGSDCTEEASTGVCESPDLADEVRVVTEGRFTGSLALADAELAAGAEPIPCAPGMQVCSSGCVDLQVDPRHCGLCERTCTPRETCTGGSCIPLRLVPVVSALSQATDFGALGTVSTVPESAEEPPDRSPAAWCPPEETLCADGCVDLRSDFSNCGACAAACSADQTCRQGTCVVLPSRAPRATISLTFDDTFADQLAAVPMLTKYGMHATFYVNSTRVGRRSSSTGYPYLTREDLLVLQDLGHEIGGHTLHHIDVVAAAPDERRRQICDDRRRLMDLGLSIRSFAYPLGRRNDDTMAAARECGYRSARITNHQGLEYPPSTIAPPRFELPAAPSVVLGTSLDAMKREVLAAEASGGWVVFVMHHVCLECTSRSSIHPETLSSFLSWLSLRRGRGTVVRTVGDVVGEPAADPPLPPPEAAPPPTGELLRNGSFEEQTLIDTAPDCWTLGTPGASTVHIQRTMDAYQGLFGLTVDGRGRSSNDRNVAMTRDSGGCAIPVASGQAFELGGYVKGSPFTYRAFLRDRTGFWESWEDSELFVPVDTYAPYAWALPPIPPGVEALAVGLRVEEDGVVSMDNLYVREVP